MIAEEPGAWNRTLHGQGGGFFFPPSKKKRKIPAVGRPDFLGSSCG